MRYSTHDYAKALDRALADPKADKKTVAMNFSSLVRRNGDEGRFRKILDEAARLLRGKHGVREVAVESARPLGKSQGDLIKKSLQPGDVVRYAVNPDLIAGIKLIINDEMQFDGSMKARLDTLFGAN